MKPNLSLSIPTPCAEKWGNFAPAINGGFCNSCSKVVVDFTKMSDSEILNFFTAQQAHTCGRFRADQLKTYSAPALLKVTPGMKLLKVGFVSLLLLLVSKQGTAQTITTKAKMVTVQHLLGRVAQPNDAPALDQIIRGTVKSSEDGSTLSGVNISLKGSAVGVVSDTNGSFEFPQQLKEGDVLVFSFIGLNTKEYSVPKKNNEDSVIVMSMQMCDMVMMGEVTIDGVYTHRSSGLRKLWSKVSGLF